MFRTWCFVAERTYDLSADPVGTLSPFGERDGVRGLQISKDPQPLTPTLSLRERDAPSSWHGRATDDCGS